ncbi:MAG: GspE/PulE family protein [Rhodothermales bacterium]
MRENHIDAPLNVKTSSAGDGAIEEAVFTGGGEGPSSVTEAPAPLELNDRVVITLLFEQVVAIEHVNQAWKTWRQQAQEGKAEALWRVLAEEPGVDRSTIFAVAARLYAFEEVTVPVYRMTSFLLEVHDDFTESQWSRMLDLGVFPVAQEPMPHTTEPRWIFATFDPLRQEVNDFLNTLNLPHFELRYFLEEVAEKLVAEAFPRRNEYLERIQQQEIAYDLSTDYETHDALIDEEALEAQISQSALINLFEAMLIEAVREGASDIHIWPNDNRQIEIHFRYDGKLHPWHTEGRIHPEAFLAVVKDNAKNVDRFERDRAQDGFIQRRIDETIIRFRVSVLPITNAAQNVRSESIVIRVLDDRKVITNLNKLGLDDLALQRFEEAIAQPYGMVILTGPTGSGKTTTLYAALQQVATPDINVLTVEDPVEYNLPQVRQIKLNPKLRLEDALRAILRHDPDVVMVGEMRDRPTAELAIKLANTGHLTFSTLHTNDAASAVSRLYKMGIEPFLIAYAINLVVAQRLIRTLCPACKQVDDRRDVLLLEQLGFSKKELKQVRLYTAGHNAQCRRCGGSGYKGRRAITETMPFSEEIRRLIVTAHEMIDEAALRKQALAEGMLTLADAARRLVLAGETSIDAMRRVVFSK